MDDTQAQSPQQQIESENVHGSSPASKQGMLGKRGMRDLNTRLQMYVRSQTEMKCAVQRLKEAMANQEIEFREKAQESEKSWADIVRKLRKENEAQIHTQMKTNEELREQQKKSGEFQELFHGSEARTIVLESQAQARHKELHLLKQECEQIRSQFASIKHKYDTYASEQRAMKDQIHAEKSKNAHLTEKVNKKSSDLRTEREVFQRSFFEKNEELEKASARIKTLENGNSEFQESLRTEFDEKLAVFVLKREEQYKQEKNEWMRIFKEEYNRKLRSFKEANFELSHANRRLEGDSKELRLRTSKLKQNKAELEHSHRSLEQEVEKIRCDLDDLRLRSNHELKQEKVLVHSLRDRFVAKELQFNELANITEQMESEINLYKSILDEAETAAGYQSPQKNSRKRRRFNHSTSGTSVIGEIGIRNNYNIKTPGTARANINARADFNRNNVSIDESVAAPAFDHHCSKFNNDNEDEQKEQSCNSNSNSEFEKSSSVISVEFNEGPDHN